ncbi:YbjQ family protein [Paraburkholderia sediminicola]|uniref:YbjQ family protein n=1 Tax=Paraburkholderia sediminicola TaxID=458836 RepID=UPI0038B7039D
MVSTTLEIPSYRIEGSFGVVRGIVVRSHSVVGSIGASLQTIFGGNIPVHGGVREGEARRDAYERMVAEAEALGANAIVGMRYEATEIARGISEVLCYGTAVHARRSP